MYFLPHYEKMVKNAASIVLFVIKAPKLVQTIFTLYRVQGYKAPIVNPSWPPKIQGGRNEIQY